MNIQNRLFLALFFIASAALCQAAGPLQQDPNQQFIVYDSAKHGPLIALSPYEACIQEIKKGTSYDFKQSLTRLEEVATPDKFKKKLVEMKDMVQKEENYVENQKNLWNEKLAPVINQINSGEETSFPYLLPGGICSALGIACLGFSVSVNEDSTPKRKDEAQKAFFGGIGLLCAGIFCLVEEGPLAQKKYKIEDQILHYSNRANKLHNIKLVLDEKLK